MATPGQQFADWNSIDGSNGFLGMLAAYGIDKSGLKDKLDGVAPEGMGYKDGKFSYQAKPIVPPTNGTPVRSGVDTVNPLPPIGTSTDLPPLEPVNHDAAAHEAFGLPAPQPESQPVSQNGGFNPQAWDTGGGGLLSTLAKAYMGGFSG